MGRTKRGWYEREEIPKITLDWVKTNCKVTDREKELLRLISERKMVRRDHLEIISPTYRNLSSNTRLINRAIQKLFIKMCIDKAHEEQEMGKGNFPCIVALDRGGSILLNLSHKRRIIHSKRVIKDKEYIFRSLPANYRHINGINQLEVDTILFCEENGYDYKWVHEQYNKKDFTFDQKPITLIPDIDLSIDFNKKNFQSFIEYDTGSENFRYKTNFPIIHDKLIKYRKYKSSNLWVEDYHYFPVILFVTEDEKRLSYFNQKAKEYGLQGFSVYYKNYTEFLRHLSKLF